MPCTIQPTTGTIRFGKDHHKYGDPYTFICSYTLAGDIAYIFGAVGTYERSIFVFVKKEMMKLGAKKLVWEKLNNKKRMIEKPL